MKPYIINHKDKAMIAKRSFIHKCMEINAVLRLAYIGLLVLAMGCASTDISRRLQAKLECMSDGELIDHYKMLEMQMDDIDRAKEQSLQQRQSIPSNHYPDRNFNHLGHLHIADNWNRLKKEKELTLMEIEKRGILPP
jgi:hypothetical protein